MNDIHSVVSVDVLTLSFERDRRHPLLALHRRDRAPFAGELALPGVVLHSGERLVEGASRAVAKVSARPPLALGQLWTFDEPSRDPRGPSLSIAMWATLPAPAAHPSVEWVRIGEEPPLPFDHDLIVRTCRPLLAQLLWRDMDLTRSLLPDPFSAGDALAVQRDLTGEEPHRANLNRTLDALPGVRRVGTAAGVGRPSQLRSFRS